MYFAFENWLATQLESLLAYIVRSLGGFWSAASAGSLVFWAKILVVVGWIWAFIQFFTGNLSILRVSSSFLTSSTVTQWLTISLTQDVISCFSIANTFLPLDTAGLVLSVYVSISVVFGTYRLVKSWLPYGFSSDK